MLPKLADFQHREGVNRLRGGRHRLARRSPPAGDGGRPLSPGEPAWEVGVAVAGGEVRIPVALDPPHTRDSVARLFGELHTPVASARRATASRERVAPGRGASLPCTAALFAGVIRHVATASKRESRPPETRAANSRFGRIAGVKPALPLLAQNSTLVQGRLRTRARRPRRQRFKEPSAASVSLLRCVLDSLAVRYTSESLSARGWSTKAPSAVGGYTVPNPSRITLDSSLGSPQHSQVTLSHASRHAPSGAFPFSFSR